MLDLQSVYFGQKHKDFDYRDIELIKKVKRLASQHLRQCVNSCNGYGIVKGKMYYSGMSYGQKPGDYEKREYGYNVVSAYIAADNEETVFDQAIYDIEAKIKFLLGISYIARKSKIEGLSYIDKGYIAGKYILDFQHDPRGNTVRLYYENSFIDLN